MTISEVSLGIDICGGHGRGYHICNDNIGVCAGMIWWYLMILCPLVIVFTGTEPLGIVFSADGSRVYELRQKFLYYSEKVSVFGVGLWCAEISGSCKYLFWW
jgi:hypothetical protein